MDLSAGNIGKIIGQADCNRFSKRVEGGKKIIMVVHTGAMMIKDGSKTLGRVLISMIQKFIGRTYSSKIGVLGTPLAIYIDEAQRVLYDGIETLPAMAGSANVMTTFFIQDIAQLKAELGEDFAKIILNNCNTKVFMRCPDADTSEYVTRHFGTKNVLTGIYSPNQVTTREVEQDVIKPYDVLSLQNQDFLLLTYAGRFKGKTTKITDAKKKIEFPEARTMASYDDDNQVTIQEDP
jgi:type IV secretory pathway TraG/TraD family ATPase VirD4